MSYGHPWGRKGGLLSKEGRQIGFVLDLSDMRGWSGPKANQIRVPLNRSTLFPGMSRLLQEGEGQLLVAFVNYGADGNTKVTTSNTAGLDIQ